MNEESKAFEEFNKKIQEKMLQMNATALESKDGLSPNQMYGLLYNIFEENSVVRFRTDTSNETLMKSPFFKMMVEYLETIDAARELKLTAKGNLPRKVCLQLYNNNTLKEDMIESYGYKLNKEEDSVALQSLKHVGLLSGITKKRNNKMSLTKKGKKLFDASNRLPLFQEVFKTHITKFNLGYFDLYPDVMQSTFGFTLYLLLKYGKETRKSSFYFDKNLKAFEGLVFQFEDNSRFTSSPIRNYENAYFLRFYTRLLAYYGFIKHDVDDIKKRFNNKTMFVEATPLFFDIFYYYEFS